jgi:CHAT domain-containing protein
VVKRIRQQIPDFLQADNLFPLVLKELHANEHLAYVASTYAGSVVILFGNVENAEVDTSGESILAWWDEHLTTQAVVQLIDPRAGSIVDRHLLIEPQTALLGRNDPGKALERAMKVLGHTDGALARMSLACNTLCVKRLLTVPCGLLGLLPLHAALVPSPAGGEPEPLLDYVQVSYIPSARIWLTCHQRVHTHSTITDLNALIIGNPLPQPEAPSLPGAEEEARQVVKTIQQETHGQINVFQREKATREAILEVMKTEGSFLSHAHFACHGLVDLNDSQSSGLLLANGERLMVRDLFDPGNQLLFDRLRLVTLSACQTGIPGTDLPDEVVGLPASWLQAGATGVVASLWPVSDLVTVALMTKFYELHLSDGLEPIDALWLAQRWLRRLPGWKRDCHALGAFRGASGPEASEVLKGLALSGNTALSHNVEENGDSGLAPNLSLVHHWNNPLHWAAFAMYGA